MITPVHDVATVFSGHLADQLMWLLGGQRSVKIDRIWPWAAWGFNIRRVLRKNRYDLILYFGHGEFDGLRGLFGNIVTVDDAELFNGVKVVCVMACKSAKEFGRRLVDAGVGAYIGNDDYVYGAFPSVNGHNYARMFASVWQNEVLDLMRGYSVGRAVRYAKDRWKAIGDLAAADGNLHYARAAYLNGNHHVAIGDTELVLGDYIEPDRLNYGYLKGGRWNWSVSSRNRM